jgi:hypothetical protein
MAWDYDWRLGPKGGTLVTLDTYCKMVRLDFGAEPGGARAGRNVARTLSTLTGQGPSPLSTSSTLN